MPAKRSMQGAEVETPLYAEADTGSQVSAANEQPRQCGGELVEANPRSDHSCTDVTATAADADEYPRVQSSSRASAQPTAGKRDAVSHGLGVNAGSKFNHSDGECMSPHHSPPRKGVSKTIIFIFLATAFMFLMSCAILVFVIVAHETLSSKSQISDSAVTPTPGCCGLNASVTPAPECPEFNESSPGVRCRAADYLEEAELEAYNRSSLTGLYSNIFTASFSPSTHLSTVERLFQEIVQPPTSGTPCAGSIEALNATVRRVMIRTSPVYADFFFSEPAPPGGNFTLENATISLTFPTGNSTRFGTVRIRFRYESGIPAPSIPYDPFIAPLDGQPGVFYPFPQTGSVSYSVSFNSTAFLNVQCVTA